MDPKQSKYHQDALAIAEMFPESPFDVLIQAFEKHNGDLDKTLHYLVLLPPQPVKDEKLVDKRKRDQNDNAPMDLISFEEDPETRKQKSPKSTTTTTTTALNSSILDHDIKMNEPSKSPPKVSPGKVEVEAPQEDSKELNEAIMMVGELFPDVPQHILKKTLITYKMNVEKVIDLFLTAKNRENLKLSGGIPIEMEVEEPSAPPLDHEAGEFEELNNLFTTVLSNNDRDRELVYGDIDQLRMDEEMAKMLMQMDQDANAKVKNMEEEDRKLAEMLAQQETSSTKVSTKDDAKMAAELVNKERTEIERLRRERELQDEKMAKELFDKEKSQLAYIRDAQTSDEEFARRLELAEKDEQIAKEMQEAERKEKKKREEEEERKTKELIAKLTKPKDNSDPSSVVEEGDAII